MIAPKFAAGEVVILQSKTVPEFNGEYQVLEVVGPGEITFIGGKEMINNSPVYIYDLGVVSPAGTSLWSESLLRKSHRPGEHTFGELIASLSTPVSREDMERLDREAVRG